MNIRSSFASFMMSRHRTKTIFRKMSEATLLEYLGKEMYTSPEQLRETYVTCAETDFRACAASLTMAIDSLDESDDDSIC